MSKTRNLFESFQSNLTEIEKNIKTIVVRLSDNKQAEIEVENGNHIRKIWYTDSNGSTGFGYDEKSDNFVGFNNSNGSFLTSREDKIIKNKIHEILNNKINESVQKDESALNEKHSYKEVLEKELEKVQNSIANSDPKKDISGLESKRDFLMDKLNQLEEGTSLDKVRKDSIEKGLLSEENIYKIETKDSGAPKIELVKVLSDNGKTIKVKSIYDDYEFEYNKDYFDNNKQIASEKDIEDYKFKINESILTEAYNPLNTELYMNTWGNYNINGADVDSINGGWMDIDKAKEFLEAHKDEEPFINDTENCPISVSEYDNPWEVIEHLEKIEELDNVDAFLAILEEHNDNFDEALEIYESGDFTFFSEVDNDKDLGEAWVNMVGGIEGVSNPENYIDEDAYRESWREAAEESVREDNPEIDEDSEEFEDLVEEWLDAVVPEQLEIAISEGSDLSDYFDYEAFGRELNFGGFYYAKTGAIETY